MYGLIIGTVFLAQSSVLVPPGNRCRAMEVEVARAAYEVFLDPTEEKRTETTKRVVEGVLVPHKAEVDRCDELDLDPRIWNFVDHMAVPFELRGFYHSEHPRTFSPAYLRSLTREARTACGKSLGATQCTEEKQQLLVLLDDETAQPLFRGEVDPWSLLGRPAPDSTRVREPLAMWIELRRKFRERSEFLRAAVVSQDQTVRRWALEDATGYIDPRKWSPDDIAVLVLEARRADAEASAIETERKKDPMSGIRGPHSPRPEPREREIQIRRHLGRMGFQRVVDLIHPRDESVPRPSAEAPESGPPWDQHFPGEPSLCMADWFAKYPEIEFRKLTRSADHLDLLRSDCKRRWLETDEAAPHPDLEAIRAALKKLEAEPSREQKDH